jgi:ketosteroid isomerase-like protein
MEISEAIRVVVDTFNRDDIEGFIAACTPDAELRPIRGMLEEVVYRGHDGLREFQRDSEAAWSERHAELVDTEGRDDEAVLVAHLRMKGRASGVVTERDLAFAIRLRDGLIARIATHPDPKSARRELGWTS